MSQSIRVSHEEKRGCGYRKVGGLYLMGGKLSAPCGRLPLPIDRCPTCGHGLKQKIGFTWFNPLEFWGKGSCELERDSSAPHACEFCWAGQAMPERAGLVWIGTQFYKHPRDFVQEANVLGVSRRVEALPKGLEIDKTVVYLAHPKAIERVCRQRAEGRLGHCEKGKRWDSGLLADQGQTWVRCDRCKGTGIEAVAGVFSAFVPDRVEKVVSEETTEEEAEALRKRGIEPVIVKPIEEAEDDAA